MVTTVPAGDEDSAGSDSRSSDSRSSDSRSSDSQGTDSQGTDSRDEQVVEIFTDGACKRNPGPGGWGVILRFGRHEKELHGGDPATTNNRMEIMAAIQGLESLARPSRVRLYTDSEYLRRGITEWMAGWKRNGWRTKDRKPVKNVDLWTRLDDTARPHEVEWLWVKGHAGHPENERADELACRGAQEAAGQATAPGAVTSR